MPDWPLTFEAPATLAAAAVACAVALIVGRRAALPTAVRAAATVAILLAVVAAGQPVWCGERAARLAVFFDESPRTRGAAWRQADGRDRLLDELRRRGEAVVIDGPAVPADAGAAVLFTDGAADVDNPAAVPLWVALDPALDRPADAATTRLELDGDDVIAVARNTAGRPEMLTVRGETAEIAANDSMSLAVAADADMATVATFAAGDLWPENDALRLPPATPATGRRLWFGPGPAPAEYEVADALPRDAAALAGAGVVVIDGVRPDAAQERALAAYVEDLGGAVLLLPDLSDEPAGDLAGLSPLSFAPPEPRADVVLLIDSSGSMARPADGGPAGRRFDLAAAAMAALPPTLPPAARVSVGAFADDVTWWLRDMRAADVPSTLVPSSVTPGGGTRLDLALRAAASRAAPGRATVVIALTDAEAALADADSLGRLLRDVDVQLHIISAAAGDAGEEVRRLALATGGSFASEPDPRRWADAARRAAGAAVAEPVVRRAARVTFAGDWADLPGMTVAAFRPSWIKSDATPLTSNAAEATEPRAAAWRIGLGRVAVVSFPVPADLAGAMADRLALHVAQAGAAVEWDDGADLAVTVTLPRIAGEVSLVRDGATIRAERVGPATWRARVTGARRPAVAAVVVDGRVIERRATAGRYAADFEDLGNDRAAAAALARRYGGEVVDAARVGAWPMPTMRPRLALTAPAALASAAALLMALLLWRRSA